MRVASSIVARNRDFFRQSQVYIVDSIRIDLTIIEIFCLTKERALSRALAAPIPDHNGVDNVQNPLYPSLLRAGSRKLSSVNRFPNPADIRFFWFWMHRVSDIPSSFVQMAYSFDYDYATLRMGTAVWIRI